MQRFRAPIWLAALLLFSLLADCGRATPEPGPTDLPTPALPSLTASAPAPSASPTSPATKPISIPTATPPASQPTFTPTSTPTPARPSSLPPHGIESHSIDDLSLIQTAGASWVRRNALLWQAIEPQEGRRDWQAAAKLEAELQRATELGLEVILIVRGAPSWAQQVPGHSCGAVLPERLEAFAAFVADAVARYSQPPFDVHYYELGNEPDIEPALVGPDAVFGCWGAAGDPHYGGSYYAEMLKAVYPRVKAADPTAQVLFGGLLLNCDPLNPPEQQPGSGVLRDCTPSKFLEGALQNGAGAYFDGVSFHAYDYYVDPGHYGNGNWHSNWKTTGPSLIAKARYLRSVLTQAGFPDKYLLNTEAALLCGRTGKEEICQRLTYQQTKAGYLAQTFTAAKAEGLLVNIWYSLRGWRGSELASADNQPLPAYQALIFNAYQLSGMDFQQPLSGYAGIMGYAFQRDQTRLWVAWALSDEPQTLSLPELPAEVYDTLGEPLEAAQQLNLTTQPVYIVWHP